jgi:hypothetical protein
LYAVKHFEFHKIPGRKYLTLFEDPDKLVLLMLCYVLKTKWTDRITNDEVFQRGKIERLLLKILKNRRHSRIGHTLWHNEFVVNILEGAISGKEAVEEFDYST